MSFLLAVISGLVYRSSPDFVGCDNYVFRDCGTVLICLIYLGLLGFLLVPVGATWQGVSRFLGRGFLTPLVGEREDKRIIRRQVFVELPPPSRIALPRTFLGGRSLCWGF